MEKTVVNVEFSLTTFCPHCEECINLFDHDGNDDDMVLTKPLLSSEWELLEDEEVICPDCGATFAIERVEY